MCHVFEKLFHLRTSAFMTNKLRYQLLLEALCFKPKCFEAKEPTINEESMGNN